MDHVDLQFKLKPLLKAILGSGEGPIRNEPKEPHSNLEQKKFLNFSFEAFQINAQYIYTFQENNVMVKLC